MKSLKLVLLGLLLLWGGRLAAQQWDGTSASSYVLDEADSGSDVTLHFGTITNKFLQWDTTNLRFNLNDTLRVTGNLEQEGVVLTFDADNTAAGADVDIVAHQGSDNAGTLRYSASNDRWEISNDGGTFQPIASGSGGGGVSGFEATLANDGATTVTHASDPNNHRIVQVKEFISATGATDNSLDFEVGDEADYSQEEATNGTDFLSSSVRLHGSFSGTGTTNLAQGQTATASSSSQPASNAVDGNNNSFWYTTAGGSNGGWLQVDLGASAPPVNQAQIRWYNTAGTYNCTTFEIQGTNTDGSNYVTVYTGNTVGDPQNSTYNFAPGAYRYWRFLCTVPNNASYYVLNEVRLFEALATYPTTPYFVTTNTNSLSTSSWTGVTALNITQSAPASTSVRYLVSFDGRNTWHYWNGSAWTLSSLANLQTEGMTEATIEGLSSGNWFSAGGINNDAAQTLDFAFDLQTSDNSVTPSVEQISVDYTTPTYWTVNTDQYEIQEFNDTQTQVTNRSGATKQIKISVIVP